MLKGFRTVRVLITNLFLSGHSGTETVSELLADGLRRSGHSVVALAPTIGALADRMRSKGHEVYDRIAEITDVPDVIHAQHVTPALIAMARFPKTPTVFTCHSSYFTVEAPILHPQIRQWVAVDEACRLKSVSCGVPSDRLSVIHNAVDLERFVQRDPLPAKPVRGLMLTKNREHQAAIRQACILMNIQLDELGPATSNYSTEIEKNLVHYDIVFATARMAIEAAAVGCAVVVCDARGFAGLLSTKNMESWRQWNLGAGLLVRPTTAENVVQAISEYDAADTCRVTDYIRSVADLQRYTENYVQIYQKAINENAKSIPADHALATAQWIEELAVSASQRKWSSIAIEMGMKQRPNEQGELLARIDNMAEELGQLGDVETMLQSIDKNVVEISRFTNEVTRLYGAITPTFLRKLLHKWRHSKNTI